MGMVWVAATASDVELAELRKTPDAIYDFVNPEEECDRPDAFNLDKQWQAVHYLLTGSAGATDSPLSIIIGRFETFGPDYGYGPAWIVPKQFVVDCHAALSKLSDAEIVDRFAPQDMVRDDVYIAAALADEGDEAREFLESDVERLRDFIATAAQQRANLVAMIT